MDGYTIFMAASPDIAVTRNGDSIRIALNGSWTIDRGKAVEQAAAQMTRELTGARSAIVDFSGLERMDTAGAWLIDRARRAIEEAGVSYSAVGLTQHQDVLLHEAGWRAFDMQGARRSNASIDFLEDIGKSVYNAGVDFVHGVAFLGEAVVSLAKAVLHPRNFRLTSIVAHLENFGFRSVPIILLINYLVGCIVAQQGIFQLRKFGAETFTVDLIGILILRELGVLLTSIMIAGRSGSAITAEIGSMKMREEIDALKVMGLSPMQVLVAPRLIALMCALPMLTFLANMAAIAGGMTVAWLYGNTSPEAFLSRLQVSITYHTFMVGMIKAPFMALVIGIIGAMEGMATEGSAESLGRRVTASVVKAIFMVIVVDGLFAMFFAAINY